MQDDESVAEGLWSGRPAPAVHLNPVKMMAAVQAEAARATSTLRRSRNEVECW